MLMLILATLNQQFLLYDNIITVHTVLYKYKALVLLTLHTECRYLYKYVPDSFVTFEMKILYSVVLQVTTYTCTDPVSASALTIIDWGGTTATATAVAATDNDGNNSSTDTDDPVAVVTDDADGIVDVFILFIT